MRSFIKLEREFITFLVHSDRGQRKVMSFLDNHLERTRINLNIRERSAEYEFEGDGENFFGWMLREVEDLQEIIAIIINLVVYLESNGYIASYEVTQSSFKNVHSFGKKSDESLSISTPFPDRKIEELLVEYVFKEIVPLEPLKYLEEHEFISADERRFTRQYKQAKWGIVVAIVIGLAGIYFNFVTLNKQEEIYANQERSLKKTLKPFTENIENIIGLDKKRNEDLIKLRNGIKSLSDSHSRQLNKVESLSGIYNNQLKKIEAQLKDIVKTNKNGFNKQSLPSQKPHD